MANSAFLRSGTPAGATPTPKKAQPEIILLRESAKESWLRDASSVVSFVALIGIGVVLDSSAMQWVGGFLGFLTLLSGVGKLKKENTYTVAEARALLDKIERGEG